MFLNMLPEAMGQPAGKKRFVMFSGNLGVLKEHRPVSKSETDFTLGSFSALEPYKKDVTIAGSFYHPFNGHLHGNFWPFCAANGALTGTIRAGAPYAHPGGPSFDRFLAQTIGKSDPVSSLPVGAFPIGTGDDRPPTVSADGPKKPYPSISGPVALFRALFDGSAPASNGTSSRATQTKDTSVLDFVVDDVKRFRARLGGPEKVKLEQYLGSIEEVEDRLTRIGMTAAMCTAPPTPDDAVEGRTAESVPLTADVLAVALACGFTRVAAVNYPDGQLPFLGENGKVGGHAMWHGEGTPAMHAKYYRMQSEGMARLWKRLGEFPEEGGTVADRSLLMYMNCAGGSHHNQQYDYWTMMVGSAGGALRTGRYLTMPQSPYSADDLRRGDKARGAPPAGRSGPDLFVGDLFTSVAAAMGANVAKFGDSAHGKGIVPGLL
jgi:hypothetical protein